MTDSAQRMVVSVGTDHHPFSRLMDWIVRWSSSHPETEVFIQCGTSVPPSGLTSTALVPHAELLGRFADADVVVTHGGPATIMDARQTGHIPVVLPRRPELGEHVDNHQLLFTARLAESGQIHLAKNYEDLDQHLVRALADATYASTEIDQAQTSLAVRRVATLVSLLEQHNSSWRRGPFVLGVQDNDLLEL